MKANLLFSAFFVAFSISGFAQNETASSKSNSQLLAEAMDDEKTVISYHVEERINMKFGSSITSYNVSSLSLVRTNDLGPNNTRTVTPVYSKVKSRLKTESVEATPTLSVSKTIEAPQAIVEIPVPATPVKTEVAPREKKEGVAIVDIIATYERILEKGYKSVDMLKKVANARFFDGSLAISAKWYDQLFALTTDLEPVYYYRYAASLKAVNQHQKASEMMAVFEKSNP